MFTNLSPGFYIMSIVDNDNCLNKDTMYILHNPNFPLQLTSTSKLMNCYGELSGFAAMLTTIGGTPPYSYEWFDGSYNPIGTGDSISGLSGGVILLK